MAGWQPKMQERLLGLTCVMRLAARPPGRRFHRGPRRRRREPGQMAAKGVPFRTKLEGHLGHWGEVVAAELDGHRRRQGRHGLVADGVGLERRTTTSLRFSGSGRQSALNFCGQTITKGDAASQTANAPGPAPSSLAHVSGEGAVEPFRLATMQNVVALPPSYPARVLGAQVEPASAPVDRAIIHCDVRQLFRRPAGRAAPPSSARTSSSAR